MNGGKKGNGQAVNGNRRENTAENEKMEWKDRAGGGRGDMLEKESERVRGSWEEARWSLVKTRTKCLRKESRC